MRRRCDWCRYAMPEVHCRWHLGAWGPTHEKRKTCTRFIACNTFRSNAGSGTTIIIPLDRVPNVATEIAMRLFLCFSPDGVDWYQMDNEYITVALLHPHVISAVSPTAIVSGNTVLITQVRFFFFFFFFFFFAETLIA